MAESVIQELARLTRRAAAKSNPLPVWSAWRAHAKYRGFTIADPPTFIGNFLLSRSKAPSTGCIVECGVWRGGMSAGLAEALPGRIHYLFDSFEGLPPAKEVDGCAALAWQADTTSSSYRDNLRAERKFAEMAMRQSPAKSFALVQGWFKDTLPDFVPQEPIGLLRLDSDWYEPTLECLSHLYQHVVIGGLIIVDDYFIWAGCARAVHDFLSQQRLCDRIESAWPRICYIIKQNDE